MERSQRKRQYKRFKRISFIFTALVAVMLLFTGTQATYEQEGPYYYDGLAYGNSSYTTYAKGYVLELTESESWCHSYVLLPGFSLVNSVVLAIFYLLVLFFLFLGIAIVADIFMAAIEVITSQTANTTITDKITGETKEVQVLVWNATIANLTLMALGSSAPEILLSCIETISLLGQTPGELGPSTIVGSAAFNLLVISAVSIVAVKDGIKKIDDLGVFTVTCSAAMFAYIWLFLCLQVITPDEITMLEACLTLGFFFVLVILAFIADRVGQYRRNKSATTEELKEEEKQQERISAKATLRKLSDEKGIAHVIGAVTKNINV